MYSGTVPMMIYYGIKFLHPKFVVVTAFIVTAIVSTFTGTSWGFAATSGVAFMGIAGAMGVPLPLVAGAIISGAFFGDKVSPVSDTTNLSAMASEVTVYDHIIGNASKCNTKCSYINNRIYFCWSSFLQWKY